MKATTKINISYKCEICETSYVSESAALECESKKVTYDKGVKIGDIVRIIGGEGSGELAKVVNVYVIDMHWGHYAWKRYWHTVALEGECLNRSGTRILTFDHYELVD